MQYSLILFMFISGFRLSERLISILIHRSIDKRDINSKTDRVLIVGGGDRGSLALREILQNKNLGMSPIGFIDDDPSKKSARIDGYPVIGGISNLDKIIKAKDITKIIISTADLKQDRLNKIESISSDYGIQVKSFFVDFN